MNSLQRSKNNMDGKTFKEYQEFGLILQNFVNKADAKIDEQKQEIHQLKV
jgi:hypothetical protein